jgi:hypothetical protein
MLLEVPDLGNVKIGAACGIAPTLRTEREEWGTHFVGRVRMTERPGHPPKDGAPIVSKRETAKNQKRGPPAPSYVNPQLTAPGANRDQTIEKLANASADASGW